VAFWGLDVGMHVRPWKRGHMLDVGSLVLLVSLSDVCMYIADAVRGLYA
jgi:hypothetical protein